MTKQDTTLSPRFSTLKPLSYRAGSYVSSRPSFLFDSDSTISPSRYTATTTQPGRYSVPVPERHATLSFIS